MNQLTHEKLITSIYSSIHWDRIPAYIKNSHRYNLFRDHMLEEKPDPHVILISGMSGDMEWKPEDAPLLLNIPFATCVFESIDKPLFDVPSNEHGPLPIYSFIVTEINGQYGFAGLSDRNNICQAVDPNSESYKLFMTIAHLICGYINSKNNKAGQSKTNIRFKHKKTGIVKIKKLVHIGPKTASESHQVFDVDWSHRWEVRGHWRKLEDGKLGKDRAGKYCIAGATWVSEHVKGPDDMPLVSKTRFKVAH